MRVCEGVGANKRRRGWESCFAVVLQPEKERCSSQTSSRRGGDGDRAAVPALLLLLEVLLFVRIGIADRHWMPNRRLLQASGLVNRRLEAEDCSDSLVVDDSDLVRLAEDCSANSENGNTKRIHEQRASAGEKGNSAR